VNGLLFRVVADDGEILVEQRVLATDDVEAAAVDAVRRVFRSGVADYTLQVCDPDGDLYPPGEWIIVAYSHKA